MEGSWKLCLCSITAVLSLLASTITLSFLYGSRIVPASKCHGLWGPNIYLHRGNRTHGQENTESSSLNTFYIGNKKVWSEMDISVSKDGIPFLFHDKTMKRVTGGDADFSSVSSTTIRATPILPIIDGYDYGRNETIPELKNIITTICSKNPNAGIDLDIKDSSGAKKSVKLIKNSSCTKTAESKVFFATGYPHIILDLKNYLKASGLKNRISVSLHPGSYGHLGLYFFLKTGSIHALGNGQVSILSTHRTVWDKDLDLIKKYIDVGYCAAIYGIKPHEISKYPLASYYVVDEAPVFPISDPSENVVYNGSRAPFILLAIFGFISIPIFLLSCFCIFKNREHCCCKQKSDNININRGIASSSMQQI